MNDNQSRLTPKSLISRWRQCSSTGSCRVRIFAKMKTTFNFVAYSLSRDIQTITFISFEHGNLAQKRVRKKPDICSRKILFVIFEKLQLSFSLYSDEVTTITITITITRRIRTCFRINLHYTDTPLLLSTVQLRLLEAVTYYYCCSNPVAIIIQTLLSSEFSSSQLKNIINHN